MSFTIQKYRVGMYKLSVITVTYNAEATLERTLRSVQSQSQSDIEHIIVDGNSQDGTVALIERYANERTNWVSEPDKGLYDAMNKAAAMATGDYLCFLNAGDTFHADTTVEEMMRSIPQGSVPDIIYGQTAIVDGNGRFLHMRRLEAPKVLTWKSFKQGMLVCHQAFIVRRGLFEPYDLGYRFSSDFDWAVKLLKRAQVIHYTDMTLIDYLNEGLTTTNHKASLKERYKIMTKHYGQVSTALHHAWFVVRALFK